MKLVISLGLETEVSDRTRYVATAIIEGTEYVFISPPCATRSEARADVLARLLAFLHRADDGEED